jgi:hypothetical protein
VRGTEQLAAGKDFLAPSEPSEPSPEGPAALASVIKSLELLTPDERKRVLHAATAFYRVQVTR